MIISLYQSGNTSAVKFDLVERQSQVVRGVLLFEGDGSSQRHVLVDGETLGDGRCDVFTEVVRIDASNQHRTTPLCVSQTTSHTNHRTV